MGEERGQRARKMFLQVGSSRRSHQSKLVECVAYLLHTVDTSPAPQGAPHQLRKTLPIKTKEEARQISFCLENSEKHE